MRWKAKRDRSHPGPHGRDKDRWIVWTFGALGFLSLLIGVVTPIYTYAAVKPKFEDLEHEMRRSIALVQRGLEVIDEHPELTNALRRPPERTLGATPNLVQMLETTAKASSQVSDLLGAFGATIEDVSGLSILVMAEDSFDRVQGELDETKATVDRLAPVLVDLAKQSRRLSASLKDADAAAERLAKELDDANVTLSQAELRLSALEDAIERAQLPAQASRFGTLQGGVYIVLSFVLWGIGGIFRRLADLRIERIGNEPVSHADPSWPD